ncbi:MAG: hypothetical protein R3A10_11280 [Caldilineaceae bacterium]
MTWPRPWDLHLDDVTGADDGPCLHGDLRGRLWVCRAGGYQPDNSYLNIVLAQRTGSRFCSVWSAWPWAAPGPGHRRRPAFRHFMVRYRHGEESWLLDPFRPGAAG